MEKFRKDGVNGLRNGGESWVFVNLLEDGSSVSIQKQASWWVMSVKVSLLGTSFSERSFLKDVPWVGCLIGWLGSVS